MSVDKAKGLFYAPSPPPQSGGEVALRQWCEREFSRIADAIREGRSSSLRLDVLVKDTDRHWDGLVGFFAAGIPTVGATEGLYEYRGGAWHKL